MADWFVDDAATDNTGTGAWDDPLKYLWLQDGSSNPGLFGIGSPPAAGDTVYVLKDHVEDHGSSSLTLTNNGTKATPIKIIGVDSFNSGSPDTPASTQSCVVKHSGGASGADIISVGSLYIDRFTFEAGDEFRFTNTNTYFVLENGLLKILRNLYGGIYVNPGISSEIQITLINSDIEFAYPNGHIHLYYGIKFSWYGGTLTDGTETLFSVFDQEGEVDIRNVDLSNTDVSYLIGSLSGLDARVNASFVGCKIGSGVSVVDSSILSKDSRIYVYGSNSNIIYEWQEYCYEGSIVSATNCKRSGGATYDGTNGYSAKMVSSANTGEFIRSLRFKLAEIWCSANPTMTIEFIHDSQGSGSGGDLQNDEFWIEIEYPDSAIGAFRQVDKSTKVSNSVTSPSDHANSSETWTEDLSSEVKQYCQATISGGQAGIHTIWAHLAKPSTTVYVCPKVDVS